MEQEFKQRRFAKLLELIGSTQGQERLDSILTDEKLLQALDTHDSSWRALHRCIYIPTYLLNFIYNLSKTVNPKSHLDPWVTILSPIVHRQFDNSIAICYYQSEVELIKTVFPGNKAKIISSKDTLAELDKIKDKFEFISCFPPFGIRVGATTISGHKTPNDFGSILLLKSSTLLADNGLGVFLMPSSFLFNKTTKETIKALEALGLFIEAMFSVPLGAAFRQTLVATSLVVITKAPKDKTFVAELSADERTNKVILDNFKNRREGKAVQLGSLVDINEFTSLQALILEKEIQEMVKQIGYPPISLTEITLAINTFTTDNPNEVTHLINSIYFPKISNSPVVTEPTLTKIKPKNYYQILLDNDKANSTYVANYFNSPLGKRLRQSLAVGATMLRIPESHLSKCVLHIPDINTQSKVIEIDSKIDQLILLLGDRKRTLWKQPRSYKNILKDLKNINQEEKLEHWIDTLPFPISSILWHYYATKENSRKVEHLFHFFEALSEFLSMIMLSSFVQDKEFYKQECHRWIDTDEKFKDWYLRATFGNWNILTGRLAKATRQYLSEKERSDYCNSLYGNPSNEFMDAITSKYLIEILKTVADLRNEWKGHGGITNAQEDYRRATTLELHLNNLRKFLAGGFEETRLISPTKGEYEDGVFNFNAKELIGVKTPFNEISIESLIPLDKKKLYLSHTNQNKPLELLPFIKFVETSEACYFYTSIESKSVRWISYHCVKNPEIVEPADNELFKAFEFLKPS